MGTSTAYLNLYKTNMLTDGDDFFDFKRDLDDNWDKIDTCCALMNTAVSTKANSALDNLTDGGKAKFDEKWISSNTNTIFENRTLSKSETPVEFILDFLPDNETYELLLYCYMTTINSTASWSGGIRLSSEIITTPTGLNHLALPAYGAIGNALTFWVKNKKIYLSGKSYYDNAKGTLTVIAYRKLGVGFATTNESEVTQDE